MPVAEGGARIVRLQGNVQLSATVLHCIIVSGQREVKCAYRNGNLEFIDGEIHNSRFQEKFV